MAIMRRSINEVNPRHEMSVEEFKIWLSRFDSDHDGRISREELKQALSTLHLWFASWKARRGMKEADANRNGLIDNAMEIQNLVNYAQQTLHMKIYQSNW